ncbi:MAG TPA: TetR/AcrR family transcriptional regulator C-terminal domain-containing protein [Conexibacter sp.]|nr:TetR/AcrR family transcriptional regulator C-terminal domain-containing protein [Conexibacter sp.]
MSPRARTPPKRAGSPSRPRLSRQRVLHEAARLVDEQGLDALTMRALAGRLGVEAMSLYGHVVGKGDLRDGIAEQLWAEVERSFDASGSWQDALRSLALGLRSLAVEHSNCFPLLVGASAIFTPTLRIFQAGHATLRAAGFDDERAAKTVNAVVGYAIGYGAMELSCLAAGPSGGDEAQLDAVVRLTRALPASAPAELVRVAHDAAVDVQDQFAFGLEALLAGLAP